MKREEIIDNIRNGLVLFKDISSTYYNDSLVMIEAIKRYGSYVIDYVSKDLFNDKSFIIEVIDNTNIDVFSFFSNDLLDNKEIAIKIVSKRGLDLEFCSDTLRKDFDVVYAAVKSNWEALKYADEDLRSDGTVAKLYILSNNYSNLRYLGKKLKNDKNFLLPFISMNGNLIKGVSEELKNDKDVVRCAVLSDVSSLRYAGNKIKNDAEFMIELIKLDERVLKYVSEDLKKDSVFMVRATNSYQVSLF